MVGLMLTDGGCCYLIAQVKFSTLEGHNNIVISGMAVLFTLASTAAFISTFHCFFKKIILLYLLSLLTFMGDFGRTNDN